MFEAFFGTQMSKWDIVHQLAHLSNIKNQRKVVNMWRIVGETKYALYNAYLVGEFGPFSLSYSMYAYAHVGGGWEVFFFCVHVWHSVHFEAT